MIRKVALPLLLLLLTSCGSGSEEEQSAKPEATPIVVEKSSAPTASSASDPKDEIEFIAGEVVSCRGVKFHDKPEKDLILNCLDGAQGFNVGAIQGPAVVNVWGSWCPPCVGEIPIFVEFFRTMDPSIQLIGIDYQDGPLFAVKPFIRNASITWPNFVDPDGSAAIISGTSIPVTWFIDSSNNLAFKKFGPVASISELRALSKKYLGVS